MHSMQSRCLSCKPIIATTTFESIQTEEQFNMYHRISCKNYCYLLSRRSTLQNTVCRKVRNSFSHKSEQSQKGNKKSKACKHFNNWNHVSHKHGKCILIEQLSNIKNTSNDVLKQRLKEERTIGWKNCKHFGLNQELN